MEVIVHRVPEVLTEEHQLLQERILPLLFMYVPVILINVGVEIVKIISTIIPESYVTLIGLQINVRMGDLHKFLHRNTHFEKNWCPITLG